jgi:phosphopantetheinyl transferase (holo-ACP synthase)
VSVAVDVVDLRRIARLRHDCGDAFARRVLHQREHGERGDLDRRLAAAVAVKEAWIKARGERPAGWSFADLAVVPETGAPEHVRLAVEQFAADLGATSVETCTVDGRWACHGVHERWLIAAVLA